MDTLEDLHKKINGAAELNAVVRTMKALAASNIGQYEMAVQSLKDYYNTIVLGINAYFITNKTDLENPKRESGPSHENNICAIVFGSDQGLVGRFNDSLMNFVSISLKNLPGKKEIWAIGERIQLLFSDAGFSAAKLFTVPVSVKAITALTSQLLLESENAFGNGHFKEIHIFHNRQNSGGGYEQFGQRLLPLDKEWKKELGTVQWPSKKIPQVIGNASSTLKSLIHEYLFVSLFKSCAESSATENSSRLMAMQRAEKNIEELLGDLNQTFNRSRQNSIDEELFDVVSGFEALKNSNN